MFDQEELDSQIRDKQKSIRYDLRSYSTRMVVEQFQNGEFYIPLYHREGVWNKKFQSLFIESVIIGLPASTLFIARTGDGRQEIIDGAQRIKTLEEYVNGDIKLTGLEELSVLNDTAFFDLPRSKREKFKDRAISFITLSDDTPYKTRLEIFHRMNAGSAARTSLKMDLLAGPFTDFIREIAENPIFNDALNLSNFMKIRGERDELVLRFFALSDSLERYRGNMISFLNRYFTEAADDFDRDRMSHEFERTCIFVNKYLRDIFHSKERKVSKMMFDSVFVGVNLALKENSDLIPGSLSWISKSDYKIHTMVHAAQTCSRVRNRILYVKERLLKGG
ncbi:MAG: DUF262 domain-containing protein [Gammaproteobacteria bacterium]|nr:DUF262 domain-containing protein [Gammaproteobacteria bacterium]